MINSSTAGEDRSQLVDFLTQKVNESSFRGVEEKTGVSKGSLENLTKGRNRKLPELETLAKIADAYNLPRWKMLEMAGFDLDLDDHKDLTTLSKLRGLTEKLPGLSRLINELIQIHPDDINGVLIYIEVSRRLRQERVNVKIDDK